MANRIDTPQPITKKFVICDYIGEPYSLKSKTADGRHLEYRKKRDI